MDCAQEYAALQSLYRQRLGMKYRAPSEIGRELEAAEAEAFSRLRTQLSKRARSPSSADGLALALAGSPPSRGSFRAVAARKLSAVCALRRKGSSIAKLDEGLAAAAAAAAPPLRAASLVERRKRPSMLLRRQDSQGKASTGSALSHPQAPSTYSEYSEYSVALRQCLHITPPFPPAGPLAAVGWPVCAAVTGAGQLYGASPTFSSSSLIGDIVSKGTDRSAPDQ